MTPILSGRIQSRIFLVGVVGGIWTLIIGPFVPGTGDTPLWGVNGVYSVLFSILGIVIVAGFVWELIYHGLQQFRWEKDWPTFFGLIEGIPEGVATWFLAQWLIPVDVPLSGFLVHFITTWIVTWVYGNSFIRVLFIRHRFRGGRIV